MIKTSFSIPWVSRSFLAASKFSAITSLMVFRIETTVSSEKFWEELCCPPGRFLTKLGMACLPTAVRREACTQGESEEPSARCADRIKHRDRPWEPASGSCRTTLQRGKGPDSHERTVLPICLLILSFSHAKTIWIRYVKYATESSQISSWKWYTDYYRLIGQSLWILQKQKLGSVLLTLEKLLNVLTLSFLVLLKKKKNKKKYLCKMVTFKWEHTDMLNNP